MRIRCEFLVAQQRFDQRVDTFISIDLVVVSIDFVVVGVVVVVVVVFVIQ